MSTHTTTGATEMDHMDRTLAIQTLAYGGQVTTIYTRADLGIDTAVISQGPPRRSLGGSPLRRHRRARARDRRSGIHC